MNIEYKIVGTVNLNEDQLISQGIKVEKAIKFFLKREEIEFRKIGGIYVSVHSDESIDGWYFEFNQLSLTTKQIS